MQKIGKEIQMSKPNSQDLQIAFIKDALQKIYELHSAFSFNSMPRFIGAPSVMMTFRQDSNFF